MFRTRALTAVIGLPLGFGLAYLGEWYMLSFVVCLMLLGQSELFAAARRRGCTPNAWLAGIMGAAYLALASVEPEDTGFCIAMSVVFVVLCMSAQILRPSKTHFADIGATLFGYFYVAWFFSYLILIRELRPEDTRALFGLHVPFGWAALVYVVGVTWFTDSVAYFVGKNVGRHKLCPNISPNKTLEGSYGAFLAAVLGSMAFAALPGISLERAVLLGVIFGIVGQIGDLAKSVLKREAGIKDFSTLFPGHGGVLDRFDAVLYNSVALYYYLTLVAH